MSNSERNLETLPTGSLGIIPLQSCQELGEKVDKYLVNGETKDSISTRMMQLLWATNVILISSKLLPLVLVQARQRE